MSNEQDKAEATRRGDSSPGTDEEATESDRASGLWLIMIPQIDSSKIKIFASALMVESLDLIRISLRSWLMFILRSEFDL